VVPGDRQFPELEWTAIVGAVGQRRDPIAVVEACYDLSASDGAWLQAIANAAFPLLNPVGMIAYHVDLDERGPSISEVVQAGESTAIAHRIRGMAALLERQRAGSARTLERLQAKVYSRVVRNGMREPAGVLLLSETKKVGPTWMYTLGVPGVDNVFHLRNCHIDGNGMTMLAAGLSGSRPLSSGQRAMFHMLSAHLKSGLRLRRRLVRKSNQVELPEQGAVLDASARVVEAAGDAQADGAREELSRMARQIDRARTQASGRDEEALEVWQGLVDGRWSLVEQFDADGKRFMLAHRNPEGVLDPRGLSDMECRVLALALRGYSNKLVGYHLGISESTASSHLARGMAKLNITSRVELLRTLGPFYPNTTRGQSS
jgi:DNA-binding CsgD family transcriptional regulator